MRGRGGSRRGSRGGLRRVARLRRERAREAEDGDEAHITGRWGARARDARDSTDVGRAVKERALIFGAKSSLDTSPEQPHMFLPYGSRDRRCGGLEIERGGHSSCVCFRPSTNLRCSCWSARILALEIAVATSTSRGWSRTRRPVRQRGKCAGRRQGRSSCLPKTARRLQLRQNHTTSRVARALRRVKRRAHRDYCRSRRQRGRDCCSRWRSRWVPMRCLIPHQRHWRSRCSRPFPRL